MQIDHPSKLLIFTQGFLPLITAYWFPRFLKSTLEAHVVNNLSYVVAIISIFMLFTCIVLLHRKEQNYILDLLYSLAGLLLGIPFFYLVIILFGAPVYELWQQTLLLSILLSSLCTLPTMLCLQFQWSEWIDVVLNIRSNTADEMYIAYTTIGACSGAYLGAIPIPLDWDRPWQQWPLTCVYGCLAGHAIGVFITLGMIYWRRSITQTHSTKSD